MAQGQPQVDTATGYPMVDSVTGYPIVTGSGNGCCCGGGGGGGPTKHCFQQWEVTWSCLNLTWNVPSRVAGQNKCLVVSGANTAWALFSKTGTTCTYRRWIDSPGTACTVDGDCDAIGDAAVPAVPTSHKDCCQTCCQFGYTTGGDSCCISNFASWVGAMPVATYSGTDPNVQAMVDYYNSTVGGHTITIPMGTNNGAGQCDYWRYHADDGTNSFDFTLTLGYLAWDINGAGSATSGFISNENPVTSCCKMTATGWLNNGDQLITLDGTAVEFNIIDNFCCWNWRGTVNGVQGTCQKQPGTCDGRCNFLP